MAQEDSFNNKRLKLGELLKQKGLIEEKHIQYALNVQRVTGEKLGEVLVHVGVVSDYDIAMALSEQTGLEYVDLNRITPDTKFLARFNRNFCMTNKVLPLWADEKDAVLATSQIPDDRLVYSLRRFITGRIEFKICEEAKLINSIYNWFYFLENPIEKLLEREIRVLSHDTTMTVSPDNFLQYLLLLAIKKRSTDIHISPMEAGISISFRIDGVLRHIVFLPKNLMRIITAIKLNSDMDISEQRLPQDGSWRVNLLERAYDIRVSTIVTPYGENVVMRLLSRAQGTFSLEALGFLPEHLSLLKDSFNEPFGIILLTGPTGSGKSTTLIAGINSLDLLDKNVLTIENPIEYVVPMAKQTQVNEAAGYTFSSSMRYFLRHDPDVILIGEIRDEPTTKTALSAATTGHLVLSTLHSNTALGAIPRLIGLGADTLTLSETLVCIVSQRLVRTICPYCKTTRKPTLEETEYLRKEVKEISFGEGCEHCMNTGYVGRTVIYEILSMDSQTRHLLEQGARLYEIEQMVRERGFLTLFDVGLKKVEMGDTTPDELRRVIGRFRY